MRCADANTAQVSRFLKKSLPTQTGDTPQYSSYVSCNTYIQAQRRIIRRLHGETRTVQHIHSTVITEKRREKTTPSARLASSAQPASSVKTANVDRRCQVRLASTPCPLLFSIAIVIEILGVAQPCFFPSANSRALDPSLLCFIFFNRPSFLTPRLPVMGDIRAHAIFDLHHDRWRWWW